MVTGDLSTVSMQAGSSYLTIHKLRSKFVQRCGSSSDTRVVSAGLFASAK